MLADRFKSGHTTNLICCSAWNFVANFGFVANLATDWPVEKTEQAYVANEKTCGRQIEIFVERFRPAQPSGSWSNLAWSLGPG
jgi:hypothetical protein